MSIQLIIISSCVGGNNCCEQDEGMKISDVEEAE